MLRVNQAGTDGEFFLAVVVEGTVEDRGQAERGTVGRGSRHAPVGVGRIDGLVQRAQPAFEGLIADGGDDEKIAGPGRGDVGYADAFGAFTGAFLGLVFG